jgi:hypothetical protein
MVDGSETVVSLALDPPGLDRAEGCMTVNTGLQNPNFSLQPEPDAEFYMSNVVFQVSMPFLCCPMRSVVEWFCPNYLFTLQVGGTIFQVPRKKFEVSNFPYYRNDRLLLPSTEEEHLVLDIDEVCFRGFLRELYPFK